MVILKTLIVLNYSAFSFFVYGLYKGYKEVGGD